MWSRSVTSNPATGWRRARTVTVTVELDADPERELVIPLRLTEVGASSADYTGVPASLTFPDGVTTQTFDFRAVDDTEVEDDESLSLAFGTLPPGVTAGGETTIEIVDNDVDEEEEDEEEEDEDEDEKVKIWFELAELTGLEGAEREIKVQMTLAPGDYVTIPITTENLDGASSDDYSGIPQEITFGPNDSEKAFRVSFTDDLIDDDDEHVRLGFGSLPDWLSVGNPSESTILIYDNDDPEVTVSFAQSSYEVDEGGTVTVTVELNADPERTLMIPITRTSTNGAARPTDYRVPGKVTFMAGETSKTITFTATHDTVDDDDESVELGFGSMPDARVSAGPQSATEVAIIDDDDPFVRVSFAQPSYSVDEGGTVTVTVELDADPERTVVIPISVDNQDGATGGDYSGVPASVTFMATDMSKTINFAATQDTVDDDDERVELSFGAMPDARVSEETPSATTVAIIDDDDPFVRVSFAQSSYEVDEDGTVTVTVELNADPERTVVIPITQTRNGASLSDYSGVPASVTFMAGERSQEITFAATHDTVDDDDESVELSFGAMPDERVSEETPSATTVEIIDDDDPIVRVSFAQPSYSVDEAARSR